MLLHLRALPEPAISPRTVRGGMGAAPGWLMRPCFAGSRTTSNSSGFWPHSQGVSKTRTEKATNATLTSLRSSFMENNPPDIGVAASESCRAEWCVGRAMPSRDHLALAVTVVGTFPIPTLAARNETTATSASQSKPTGIRNVPAIEQGMVLSPSLPPRAARPAPSLGRPRAAQILGQRGRQRSDRWADRPM